jgi:hypothetical protein
MLTTMIICWSLLEIKMLITLRGAKSEAERLRAALRSTDDDLFIDNGRVIVCGKGDDGELIELGSVSLAAGYQKGVDPRMLIEKVKFG